MRPDRFSGVVRLSVPFYPRGKLRRPAPCRGRRTPQFYQLYFKEPGVPPMPSLGRDPRSTIRSMLVSARRARALLRARAAAASGGAPPSLGMVPHGGGILQWSGAPADAPAMARRERPRFLRR